MEQKRKEKHTFIKLNTTFCDQKVSRLNLEIFLNHEI